jgi:hypothetical protein
MTPDQFSQLLETFSNSCSSQSTVRLLASPTSTAQSNNAVMPAYYSNDKYEEISCKGIKPPYNGSEEGLIPFLTKLDIRRQHKGWASATYLDVEKKRYNLTTHFALLTESTVKGATESRWTSSTADQDKHTVDHDTYNARLLAMTA